jgi:hypothetical protein
MKSMVGFTSNFVAAQRRTDMSKNNYRFKDGQGFLDI